MYKHIEKSKTKPPNYGKVDWKAEATEYTTESHRQDIHRHTQVDSTTASGMGSF